MFSSENMTFWTWKSDFGQTLSEGETSQVDSSRNQKKKKFRRTTEKLKITHNTYNPKTVLQDQLMKKIAFGECWRLSSIYGFTVFLKIFSLSA